ncbi:MAG: carbamoyl-phosphate synthase large subunit [bacterium]|nr:carbamoyl-phosphate synthase large subunit [bacterium]
MPARRDIKSICVLGSGPVIIGQAAEFDYSGTQAVKALKEDGYRVILINSNPATIMTDPDLADVTYIEPLTTLMVAEILKKERPDALLATVGGQTALNLAMSLSKENILQELGVELIGAEVDVIERAENRQLFKETMATIGLETLHSETCHSLPEALQALLKFGLPNVIRPSFTLGGTGGGIAHSNEEFVKIVEHGLAMSPSHEVLIEESVLGWKEYEMEVMRDGNDNAIIVCSIENFDAMGVHTGDSITVAPAQTLTDKEYQVLRNASLAVLRAIGVKTGGSNVQFAIHPKTGRVVVIEMNPRVSRSSALASKATGYPIAKVAAKVAVGYTLDEIVNDLTLKTKAAFEPSLDYVVVKAPRFAFEKFKGAKAELTTQMQSVGEAMSIGRTFKEAFGKILCSLEYGACGFEDEAIEKIAGKKVLGENLEQRLRDMPSPERLWLIAAAFRRKITLEEISAMTFIDPWFLKHIEEIILWEDELSQKNNLDNLSVEDWWQTKQWGFTDARLAQLFNTSELVVRGKRVEMGVNPVYKRVDTCAAEFEAFTPYLYSTYEKPRGQVVDDKIVYKLDCESAVTNNKKIMVLGSGPIRIGQGIEFDYCCVQAVASLMEDGFETIMVNCNPETVSTDYDCANRLYFEPLTFEHVMNIIELEKPYGVIVQLGGQTPLKLASLLDKAGVKILGTSSDAIDRAEDRERSGAMVDKLGLKQPPSAMVKSLSEAKIAAKHLGYPLLLRPSYVLGGRAMELVYNDKGLELYLTSAIKASDDRPVLMDRFLDDAIEVDVDLICDGTTARVGGVMQHIEEAGVHSGDSACVVPPHSLSDDIVAQIGASAQALALELGAVGLVNVQFAVQKDNVYVIEVNPRASRTVPFVSKAIGVSLAKIAALLMAGKKLEDIPLKNWPILKSQFAFFSVKEAVMPFLKFPAVDALLGPEMRSTGEVMGIAVRFEEAFAKSQMGAGMTLPLKGNIFVSIADPDKPYILDAIRRMHQLGFHILATAGTAGFLTAYNIPSERVNKVRQGTPHILDYISSGGVQLMFNTTLGSKSVYDSYLFRRKAIEQQIPYYTTVEAAVAASLSIEHLKSNPVYGVKSLQEHLNY